MADTVRLSTWGWFSRAFAAGFGVMFGVFTASLMICLFSYALFAVVAVTFSSVSGNGSVKLTPSVASLPASIPAVPCTPLVTPPPTGSNTITPPSYPNNSHLAPVNPYANPANPYSGTAYGPNPTSDLAASSAASAAEEAEAVQFEAPQALSDDVQYFAPGPTFVDKPTDDGNDFESADEPPEESPVVEDNTLR